MTCRRQSEAILSSPLSRDKCTSGNEKNGVSPETSKGSSNGKCQMGDLLRSSIWLERFPLFHLICCKITELKKLLTHCSKMLVVSTTTTTFKQWMKKHCFFVWKFFVESFDLQLKFLSSLIWISWQLWRMFKIAWANSMKHLYFLVERQYTNLTFSINRWRVMTKHSSQAWNQM